MIRYRAKPKPPDASPVYAIRYDGVDTFDDVLDLAKMYDSEARAYLVSALDAVLVQTLLRTDHSAHEDFDVVKRGQWLVYSQGHDVLYVEDEADFLREHEEYTVG